LLPLFFGEVTRNQNFLSFPLLCSRTDSSMGEAHPNALPESFAPALTTRVHELDCFPPFRRKLSPRRVQQSLLLGKSSLPFPHPQAEIWSRGLFRNFSEDFRLTSHFPFSRQKGKVLPKSSHSRKFSNRAVFSLWIVPRVLQIQTCSLACPKREGCFLLPPLVR